MKSWYRRFGVKVYLIKEFHCANSRVLSWLKCSRGFHLFFSGWSPGYKPCHQSTITAVWKRSWCVFVNTPGTWDAYGGSIPHLTAKTTHRSNQIWTFVPPNSNNNTHTHIKRKENANFDGGNRLCDFTGDLWIVKSHVFYHWLHQPEFCTGFKSSP